MEKQIKDLKTQFFNVAALSSEHRSKALSDFAKLIEENHDFLLAENKKDLEEQDGKISSSLFSRLKLSESKLKDLVQGLNQLAVAKDPVGEILERRQLASGLVLEKKRCPLGLIGIVFESRPDVIPQILGLILRSGNVVALKGGKEAYHSNKAFMSLIERLNKMNPELGEWAVLMDSRADFHELLKLHNYVDLVVPRGSNQLVQMVMENTKIPVLGHADGVCHLFIDEKASLEQAIGLSLDSKVQYPSACNSIETLIFHKALSHDFKASVLEALNEAGVELRLGGSLSGEFPGYSKASHEDWATEYSDLILSVTEYEKQEQVYDHIRRYGSQHTEAIVTEDRSRAEAFLDAVDSASTMWNASTRFADGYRFGLGAEIGISTNRLHARGPVGIEGLSLYRYQLRGEGQKVADFVGETAKKFDFKELDR